MRRVHRSPFGSPWVRGSAKAPGGWRWEFALRGQRVAGGKRGKGASSLGLDVYLDFMKGKKGGKGVPSIHQAQEREGAPDVDDAEYEEEVEEEEEVVVQDDDASVKVELEVIQEEEEEEPLQEEGHEEYGNGDPAVAENEEVPETEEAISLETENREVFDDRQGPVSEPEAEEGDHHGEVASSGALEPTTSITEEEFVSEEHD